ncbi:MAG TPA: MFS transporter, partial [Anaerolineaceae bacterium]|nr:MFS transporter [Anaerolineaceae bacterium]
MSFHIPPALRYRNYRLLWLGLMISIAGSQMQLWALYWHIRTLSDQPIAVSGIGIVRFVPILLFSLFGGLVADRHDRRKVLFITQTTMTLVAVALGVLTWFGAIQIWHIYLLTAIQAIAASFDLPARQSLMPNLIPPEVLPSAFSVQSIAFEVGAIVGPALSGMVIAYAGQQVVYFINALSFFRRFGRVDRNRADQASSSNARCAHPAELRGKNERHRRGHPVHPQAPHHFEQHDPGFLRDVLLVRQHPA